MAHRSLPIKGRADEKSASFEFCSAVNADRVVLAGGTIFHCLVLRICSRVLTAVCAPLCKELIIKGYLCSAVFYLRAV